MAPYYDEAVLNASERTQEGDYWAKPDLARQNGVGCRCRCDTDVADVENKPGSCMAEWVEVAGGWTSPP